MLLTGVNVIRFGYRMATLYIEKLAVNWKMPPDRDLLNLLENEPVAFRECISYFGNLKASVKRNDIANDPVN